MSGKVGPDIYSNQYSLNLDILNRDSYVSGSAYWYDFIGNATGSFTNVTYSGEAPIRFILTSSLSSTIQIYGSELDYKRTDKTYSFWFNAKENSLRTVAGIVFSSKKIGGISPPNLDYTMHYYSTK